MTSMCGPSVSDMTILNALLLSSFLVLFIFDHIGMIARLFLVSSDDVSVTTACIEDISDFQIQPPANISLSQPNHGFSNNNRIMGAVDLDFPSCL